MSKENVVVTPAEAQRRLNRKLGFPERTYRLNVNMTADELSYLRLAAELYAEGNISRLVRHLVLDVLSASPAHTYRETREVKLRVLAPPPQGKPELRAVQG